MHRFFLQTSWFLSNWTIFAYRILHSPLVCLCSMRYGNELKLHSLISQDNYDLPINHIGICTNKICIHLNHFEVELGSFSSSISMPQEEWKCEYQRQSIQGSKQGPRCITGALKETPKSSAQPIGQATQKTPLFDWMHDGLCLAMSTFSLNPSTSR